MYTLQQLLVKNKLQIAHNNVPVNTFFSLLFTSSGQFTFTGYTRFKILYVPAVITMEQAFLTGGAV